MQGRPGVWPIDREVNFAPRRGSWRTVRVTPFVDNDVFRLAVHGLAVQVTCEVPAIGDPLEHYLGEFAVPAWPEGFAPATGFIRPYEQREVLRCISPQAQRI